MFWIGVGVGILGADDVGGVLVSLLLVEVLLWLWVLVLVVGAVGLSVVDLLLIDSFSE